MGFEIRTVEPDELESYVRAVGVGFGEHTPGDGGAVNDIAAHRRDKLLCHLTNGAGCKRGDDVTAQSRRPSFRE